MLVFLIPYQVGALTFAFLPVPRWAEWIQIGVLVGVIPIFLLFWLMWNRRIDAKNLGMKISEQDTFYRLLGYGVAIFLLLQLLRIVLWPAFYFVFHSFDYIDLGEARQELTESPLLSIAARIVWSLHPAILEEVFLRGLLFNLVYSTDRRRKLLKFVLLSSILFGLGHASYGLTAIAYTSMIGAIFALCYCRIRNVWPIIMAHVTYNLTVFF